eukprot:jgi/Phyca11/559691/estExt2_Genewise1.C_PHYCAscaffold_31026
MLLLFVGTLGTIVIIPFASPDGGFVETVNDISEACCVLTFLLQITIIGYDLNKRFKMRSVMYLTYMAESEHFERCRELKLGLHLCFSLLLHWHITWLAKYCGNEKNGGVRVRAICHARAAL